MVSSLSVNPTVRWTFLSVVGFSDRLVERNVLVGYKGHYSPRRAYCRWATEDQLPVLIKIIGVPLPEGGFNFALAAILRMDRQNMGRALAPMLSDEVIRNRSLPAFKDKPAVARLILSSALTDITPAKEHAAWLTLLGRIGAADQVPVLEKYRRRCVDLNIAPGESPHREAADSLSSLQSPKE